MMAQPEYLALQEAISFVHAQEQIDDTAIDEEEIVSTQGHVGQRKLAHHTRRGFDDGLATKPSCRASRVATTSL